MHRRVQAATLAAVTLAVLLLGVPLAVAGVVLQQEQARTSVASRADAVLDAVDDRVQAGRPVSAAVLRRALRARSRWPLRARVALPGRPVLSAGPPVHGAVVSATSRSADGVVATVAVPRAAVVASDVRLVAAVLLLAAGAVAAGWAVGRVQARRLVRPLVELGERAERLGSGQVPAPVAPTGVAEVDQVAGALARSAQRLAGRLAAERQFASDASHQLRTPLAALSLRLEEIEAASTERAVAEEARVALVQVERLTGVVDDLLARSRARPAQPPPPLPVVDVLVQQHAEWAPSFTRAGRRLDVPGCPPVGDAGGLGGGAGDPGAEALRVRANPGPLAQALATLVENSLVHGAGTTTVRARSGGEWVVVEVSDEGPGVPAALGSRIFQRRVSGADGTGLGLPLARDLVAGEGGRLELLRARPATFAVFLPAA